ncbi:hypothetical protein [Streptomyces sp. B3I8]|uniref:hypothetical protein n=1 Tax=Streptomyces sp. B3I8 TaxID=3042303 RepID=UPI00277EC716|nr:hypothetical protein [Streptomyces sp. B3I8]MDQ0784776.1 hypothetical protein [Streptomyces sp. B3I8]
MGDRVAAVAVRPRREYDLDPATVRPRLRLCLPDATRAESTEARSARLQWADRPSRTRTTRSPR